MASIMYHRLMWEIKKSEDSYSRTKEYINDAYRKHLIDYDEYCELRHVLVCERGCECD